MSLLSSVAYIRTPEVTYRTQTATNGNTGNPHSSHRLIQKISSRGNAELPGIQHKEHKISLWKKIT